MSPTLPLSPRVVLPLAALAILSFPGAARAQAITRTSAAAVGGTLQIDYTSAPTDVFVMYYAYSDQPGIFIPGIGTFYLDPFFVRVLYAAVVPLTGTHTRNESVPNDPSLIGLCTHIQALNVANVFTFTNATRYCITRSLGRILLSDGPAASPAFAGRSMRDLNDSTAGAPAAVDLSGSGLVAHASQPITHHGLEGFTPLVATNDMFTPQAEHHVDSILRPARDQRDPEVPNVKLPNGFDLHVIRDQVNPRRFHLLSVARSTGIARVLTGSQVTDQGAATHPPSVYRPQFAFTAAGDVALAVVHDSTNRPNPDVGPPDRVLLIKTDPAQTWTNGFNVLDVSPAAGPNQLHTTYDGTLRIGNGRVFVAGHRLAGAGSSLWHAPLSGASTLVLLAVPLTGTGLPYVLDYAEWRLNDAGTTCLFAIGGNGAFPQSDMDYIAIRGITAGGATVTNITAFPFATRVQTPGRDGLGGTSLRAALSPDGTRAAFIVGSNTGAGTGVCVAATDGTNAGAVTAFTGSLGAAFVTFGELHWLTNQKLLFAAGSSPATMDIYVRDVVAGTTTNLTQTATGGNTGNIRVVASFMSDNRACWYFCRGVNNQGPHRWVAVRSADNALIDITGSEFSAGSTPATRLVSPIAQTMELRRRPGSGDVVFIAGRDRGAALFGDDELWKFDAEAGTAAVQMTAHNGTNAATTLLRRIDDLVVQPTGTRAAFARGIGIASTWPEDLFVVPLAGGPVVQVSVTPVIPPGTQGIKNGSVRFTGNDLGPGIAWVQGTDSRDIPRIDAVALWNSIPPMPGGALVRLSSVPTPDVRFISIINCLR